MLARRARLQLELQLQLQPRLQPRQQPLSTWFKPPPIRKRKRRGDAASATRRVLAVVEGEPLLSVRTGESWALVGPNASGKTRILDQLETNAEARNTRVTSFGFEVGEEDGAAPDMMMPSVSSVG